MIDIDSLAEAYYADRDPTFQDDDCIFEDEEEEDETSIQEKPIQDE